MIVTTLGALVVAEKPLEALGSVRLPSSVSYRIGKAMRAVKAETAFWEEQRAAAIKELGTVDGEEIRVLPPNVAEFVARMNELAAVPVELTVSKFLLTDLPDMTPAEIDALDPFIEENA